MRRHRPLIVLALAAAGCAKKSADHDVARPADAPTQVVIAGDAGKAPAAAPAPAPAPPPAPDCKAVNRAIMSNIRRAYVAMNAGPPRADALKLWPAAPEACHTGAWYLEAALLLDWASADLVAGPIKLATPEEALVAALKQPDDIAVLARVALVSALGNGPKLPDDACARAKAALGSSTAREDTDNVAYVCARAAIAAGDGKAAKEQLAAIQVPREHVDSELLAAQAAKLNKDKKTMQAQAKLAMKIAETRARSAMLSDAEYKAIIALAKQLAAGK
jgi:hypothetical protein